MIKGLTASGAATATGVPTSSAWASKGLFSAFPNDCLPWTLGEDVCANACSLRLDGTTTLGGGSPCAVETGAALSAVGARLPARDVADAWRERPLALGWRSMLRRRLAGEGALGASLAGGRGKMLLRRAPPLAGGAASFGGGGGGGITRRVPDAAAEEGRETGLGMREEKSPNNELRLAAGGGGGGGGGGDVGGGGVGGGGPAGGGGELPEPAFMMARATAEGLVMPWSIPGGSKGLASAACSVGESS